MAVGLCEFESHLGHLENPQMTHQGYLRIFCLDLRSDNITPCKPLLHYRLSEKSGE